LLVHTKNLERVGWAIYGPIGQNSVNA
jgi:hypothetical protein